MSKDEKPKIQIVKAPEQFDAQQLMDIWASEGDMEMVVLVGIPKTGGYKYAASKGWNFEFLAIVESIVQKWKLQSLELKK